MSYYNMYSYGIQDSTNKTYNFLVNGNTDYPTSSCIVLQSNGSYSKYSKSNTNNSYIDLQSSSNSNSINMRYQNNGTFSSLLKLAPENSSTTSYVMTVGGRLASSQFISNGDSRLPVSQGLYFGQNSTGVGTFSSANNVPGFTFQSYNSSGVLQNTNMILNQMVLYLCLIITKHQMVVIMNQVRSLHWI